jgi:hypothetical protein
MSTDLTFITNDPGKSLCVVIPKRAIDEPEAQKPVIKLVDRILAAKQRDAETDTSALERELDELVYALYGLTPEEIKIVEGAK